MSDRGAEDSGGLVSRNVTINGRRTSLRLEPAMWDALAEIAKREGISLNEVIARIDRQVEGSGLTAQVRVFALGYFRAAATETGHQHAGHGLFFAAATRRRGDASRSRTPAAEGRHRYSPV